MAELEYSALVDDTDAVTRRRDLFDYTTLLVVPALGTTAIIVGEIKGTPTAIQWALIGIVALSLALGFLPVSMSVARTIIDRMKNRGVARLYFPHIRNLVDRFGDFVNQSRADTLHYLADNLLCEGHGAKIAMLAMPNVAAWTGRWVCFSQRLARQKPSWAELQPVLLEFYDMVGSYDNLCVAAVFDRLPSELANAMTARAKSNLNSFQQRFQRFLLDSEQLLKAISVSRPSLSDLPRIFAPVKPLA